MENEQIGTLKQRILILEEELKAAIARKARGRTRFRIKPVFSWSFSQQVYHIQAKYGWLSRWHTVAVQFNRQSADELVAQAVLREIQD